MNYLGDFAEDETLYIGFNTFDSNDPSASVTITDLADGDIKVHKDGSATPITTDGATIAINLNSITGNHLITIDTSADAAYSTGSDYNVRVEGTTIDGGTVNAWVGHFSIENRFSAGALRPATAGRNLVVDANGLADANTVKVGPTGSGTAQTANDMSGDVNEILTDTGEIGTAGAGLSNINLPNQIMDIVGNITGNLSGSVGSNADINTTGGAIDVVTLVTTTTTNTDMVGTDNAATATNLATVDSNVDAILLDTDEIGTAGVGLTDLGGMSTTMKGQVNTEVDGAFDTALPASPTAGSINDILDRQEEIIVAGAAATGTLSITTMTTNLSIAVNDQYNGRILTFRKDTVTANLRGQQTDITDTVTTNGQLTFTAITTAPANGDTFEIT